MKTRRLVVIVVFAMMMSLLFDGDLITSSAAGMKLNKKSIKLSVGGTFKLKVKGRKNKKVKWKSLKKSIASVNKKGKVKAKKQGKTKIVAKIGKKKLTCKVKVVASEATQTPDVTPDAVVTQSPDVTQDPYVTQTPVATQSPIASQTPTATGTPDSTTKPGTTSTPAESDSFVQLKNSIIKTGVAQTVEGKSAYVKDEGVQTGTYGALFLPMYYYSKVIYYPNNGNGEEAISMQYAYDITSDRFDVNVDTITFSSVEITAKNAKNCSVEINIYNPADTDYPVKHGLISSVARNKITRDNSLIWTIKELSPSMPDYENMNPVMQSGMNVNLDKWYISINEFLANYLDSYIAKLGFGR